MIKPRILENGYRDYSKEDINILGKISVLRKLDISIEEISKELQSVEQGKTITDRLLDAFLGYYGRFICMHFACFLNEPILTEIQRGAYETILTFLDNLPNLYIPKELEEYLIDDTENIGTGQISKVLEFTKESYQNLDKFLESDGYVNDFGEKRLHHEIYMSDA